MFNCFKDLEDLFNNRCIELTNKYFNKTIQSFDFICLTKDNYAFLIQQRENASKIITIDYYKNEKETYNNEYLFFCFDNTIFVTNLLQTSIIKYIISYYLSSTIYCFSDTIGQFFSTKCSDITINYFSESHNDIVNSNISSISQKITAKNQTIDQKLKKLKKCISAYLLHKSYAKINQYRVNKQINRTEQEMSKSLSNDKFITLYSFPNSTSKTYLKYDIEREILCVMKYYLKNKSGTKLYNREMKNYQKLKHPLLPDFYETFEDDDYFYNVIEFVNGKTLVDFNLNNLKENEVINIIFELLIAFHYIHSLGFIYRDLKPSNIIIDSNNTLVLIDFDRLLQNSKEDDNELHTAYFGHDFISPEISQGKSFSDKADIYSIGVLIGKLFLNLNNISDKILSKLKIMHDYCTIEKNPDERPSISQLIRYFYLNILLYVDEKKEIKNQLVKILEYNSQIQGLFDPDGFCTLGMIFDHGIYIDANLEKSIEYYKHASDQNDLISNIDLYIYYKNDDTKNIYLAKKYLMKGAEQNDELALFFLGVEHTTEKTFETDIAKGIEYLTRSANQGFFMAYYIIGFIYYIIPSLNKSNKSIECFQRAINFNIKKNTDIFYNRHGKYILPCHDIIKQYEIYHAEFNKILPNFVLANFYYLGILVKKNIPKSIDYFKKISIHEEITLKSFFDEYHLNEKLYKYNNYLKDYFKYSLNLIIHISRNILGNIYLNGIHVPRDLNKAIKYYESTAKQNNLIGLISLGNIYSDEYYNKINISKAVNYFLLAENAFKTNNYTVFDYHSSILRLSSNLFKDFISDKMNDLKTQFSRITENLADFYYFGSYVTKDINKAIELYKYSANLNNSNALYNLAMIYLYNEQVPRNVQQAMNYLMKSEKLNNLSASQHLGIIYYEGKMLKKDIKKAIAYFTESAYEITISQFYLGVIYYIGKYAKRDIKQSIYYFKKASSNNDPYSKNNLGIMIKNGDGFEKNIFHSLEFLNESIEIDTNDAARFNAAHIYFYENDFIKEEKNLDKSIELLINPSMISYDVGFQLLCLIIIRKCQQSLTFDNIEKEIGKFNLKNSSSIAFEIFEEITSSKLENLLNYSILYEKIKTIELIYIDRYHNITTRNSIEKNEEHQIKEINKKKNINQQFWEGFGKSLYID